MGNGVAVTGIEIIGWSGFDASDLNAKSHRVELARFIAAADPETILALLAELEATESRLHEVATTCATAERRIAELSRLLAHNIERAEEAEKRLATPVRLPPPDSHGRYHGMLTRFAIKKAGFTVEGDE